MSEISNPGQPAADIEPDDNSDHDSAFGGPISESYTTSIASSVRDYIYETHMELGAYKKIPNLSLKNGRRYHAFREGSYMLPNDEQEQDRMDLLHHIYLLLLGGKLFLAPVDPNPQRVLDFGTGTGIWAIDFADEFPSAQVIGTDLSPIQPTWVPPNCHFEVDDVESDWTFSGKFDFIHGREMVGSIQDYDKLFTQAMDNLKPGGWIEMQCYESAFFSDDGTHVKAGNVLKASELAVEASKKFGKPMGVVYEWKDMMAKAGFTNIHEVIYKLPHAPWPKDPKLKELGRYQQIQGLQAMDSYAMALYTRVLGWTKEQVDTFLHSTQRELTDRSIHMYFKVYFVYGQKPE